MAKEFMKKWSALIVNLPISVLNMHLTVIVEDVSSFRDSVNRRFKTPLKASFALACTAFISGHCDYAHLSHCWTEQMNREHNSM